jgi:acetoin utilization deacetylase AcuC-like enzyme
MPLVRRALRRLGRRFSKSRLRVVHHPAYGHALPSVPLDPQRAERIIAFLDGEGLISRDAVSKPHAASLQAVLRVHSPAYLASLDSVETVTSIVGAAVTDGERQAMLDLERLVTGGTIQAARLSLRTKSVAVNLGGGLHHATPDHGMAFCIFNDIAIAIAHLRHYGFGGRILVVDLDLHDGNGTRAAFAADPTVHTFSIHNNDWEPLGGTATTSVALGTDVDDQTYLEALRESLPTVLEQHIPEFVFYVAGTDPAADDRMGDWRITASGMLLRDRYVIEEIGKHCGTLPLTVVLSGGYGRETWRYTARFLAWMLTGREVEPPDDLEYVLRHFRRQRISVATAEQDDDWGLTVEDIFLVGPEARAKRILGVCSKHAIELSLEQVGFFDELRRRGFRHPSLEVDFHSGLGETIRLYDDSDRQVPLMELRVNRSKRAVPGMDVVYIEWLTLQNPRAEFQESNPPLPGQRYPGLGLLREVVAWLIVLCEALGLDGLAFKPAQYYMAVLGRHYVRFADPEARERFRAVFRLLAPLGLHGATRALEQGRVVDATTGEKVRWESALQVYPVSEKMNLEVGRNNESDRVTPTYRLTA